MRPIQLSALSVTVEVVLAYRSFTYRQEPTLNLSSRIVLVVADGLMTDTPRAYRRIHRHVSGELPLHRNDRGMESTRPPKDTWVSSGNVPKRKKFYPPMQ